jgi:hypothetical protein
MRAFSAADGCGIETAFMGGRGFALARGPGPLKFEMRNANQVWHLEFEKYKQVTVRT